MSVLCQFLNANHQRRSTWYLYYEYILEYLYLYLNRRYMSTYDVLSDK